MKKKSIIDKTNPFWAWHKPSKKDKDLYRKQTGLELEEIGIIKEEVHQKLMDLMLGKKL